MSLLIWELIILNQNHLKLCTIHRISLWWLENYVWATCDSVDRGSWSSLMVLTLTTFFYLSQFMKVSKFWRNCFKLFIIEWISLGWPKNLVWISHGTPYCFYRVSKILAVYPSWAFSLVSLLIWELIILNQNHLKLCTHHRMSLGWLENYVWATCDSVDRGSWSWLMVLTLTTFFYLSQFMKVSKFSRNCFKLFIIEWISLGWPKNLVWISHR